MAVGTPAPAPYQTVLDTNGNPASGAWITTYNAGTLTPVVTWADAAMTIPQSNPIIADSAGRYVAFLQPGLSYKFVFATAAFVPIRTVDFISAVPDDPSVTHITASQFDAPPLTWTPVLGGASGTSGQLYNSQLGYYIQIGSLVNVWGSLELAAKGTITGTVEIQGLPVARNAANLPPPAQFLWFNFATAYVYVTGFVTNTSSIQLRGVTAATVGPPGALATADIANNSSLNFSATYFTI